MYTVYKRVLLLKFRSTTQLRSIIVHVRNFYTGKLNYSLKQLFWFRYILFILACNCLMVLIWQLNTLPAVAGTNWVDKALAILDFNAPADNYYPPGSGLLITPFVHFPNVSLVSTFFWANIGFIFYFLIRNFIKNWLWNFVALFQVVV